MKSTMKATLFVIVSTTILKRIIFLPSANEIWNYLKKKYVGGEEIQVAKNKIFQENQRMLG